MRAQLWLGLNILETLFRTRLLLAGTVFACRCIARFSKSHWSGGNPQAFVLAAPTTWLCRKQVFYWWSINNVRRWKMMNAVFFVALISCVFPATIAIWSAIFVPLLRGRWLPGRWRFVLGHTQWNIYQTLSGCSTVCLHRLPAQRDDTDCMFTCSQRWYDIAPWWRRHALAHWYTREHEKIPRRSRVETLSIRL